MGATVAFAAVLQPHSRVVENLNAVSGVFVVLFALVAVWVELRRDRRALDAERAQREAVDHQIGALAFTVHRQLTEWARQLAGIGSEGDLVGHIQFWGEMGEGTSHPDTTRTYTQIVTPVMEEWRRSGTAQEIAERRFHEMQALAPHASPHVHKALERTFVRFYEFTGRFNRQLQVSAAHPEWRDLVIGLQSLEQAIRGVKVVVTPRLLELEREEVALPPSLLDDFASALEASLQAAPPQLRRDVDSTRQ
jgi:hypothetical protein